MPTIRIPHDLPHDEVRRRMAARADDLVKLIPGGIGSVKHEWRSADVLAFEISAMGRAIPATATVEDGALAIDYSLPMGMGFVQPMVEGIIRMAGDKLLLSKG